MRLAGFVFLLLFFSLFSETAALPVTLKALPSSEYPFFHDDQNFANLAISIDQSLAYLKKIPASRRFTCGDRSFSAQQLIDSLIFFQKLLQEYPDPREFNHQIRRFFTVYRINDILVPPSQRMLITGYYYPLFSGSLERQAPYIHPLYKVPEELIIQTGKNGSQETGRLEQGRFVPFWTRKEIEKESRLRGQELIWLKDPFDSFVLHIQGSGMIQLPDGELRGLHYAQRNGRQYTSIGKYMVDTGRMRLEEVTMDSIRQYLLRHPEERETILYQNESYIFFQWAPPASVIGSLGRELTPGRSIAADRQWYPPGALVFLDSRRPVMEQGSLKDWQRMQRFVTVQDSGSALKGPSRIDIFWGSGEQAGQEAGCMKENGFVYLLVLKTSQNSGINIQKRIDIQKKSP